MPPGAHLVAAALDAARLVAADAGAAAASNAVGAGGENGTAPALTTEVGFGISEDDKTVDSWT